MGKLYIEAKGKAGFGLPMFWNGCWPGAEGGGASGCVTTIQAKAWPIHSREHAEETAAQLAEIMGGIRWIVRGACDCGALTEEGICAECDGARTDPALVGTLDE